MKNGRKNIGFEMSISGNDDGTLEAAYLRFRHTAVARSAELVEDVLIADYDSRGNLVGFEILAPVRLSQLTREVDAPLRTQLRRFVRATASPRLFVA